jgi:hypothetical protein
MAAEQALAASGLLTPEQAAGRMKTLLAYKPPMNVHRSIDQFERLSLLSALAYTMVYDPRKAVGGDGNAPSAAFKYLRGVAFDGDEALRTVNKFYDRLATAARESDPAKASAAIRKVTDELFELKKKREENSKRFFLFREKRTHPDGPRAAAGQQLGEIFLELMTPAVSMAYTAIFKAQASQRMAVLSYALASHKKNHGRYPEKLDAKELGVPPETLVDPMNGQPLVYRTKEGKRQVVSVGLDGRLDDERGRRPLHPNDLVLELP